MRNINIKFSAEALQGILIIGIFVYTGLTLLMQYTENIWILLGNFVIFIFISVIGSMILIFSINKYISFWNDKIKEFSEYWLENKYKGDLLVLTIFFISNIVFIISSIWQRITGFNMFEFLIDILLGILLNHI